MPIVLKPPSIFVYFICLLPSSVKESASQSIAPRHFLLNDLSMSSTYCAVNIILAQGRSPDIVGKVGRDHVMSVASNTATSK